MSIESQLVAKLIQYKRVAINGARQASAARRLEDKRLATYVSGSEWLPVRTRTGYREEYVVHGLLLPYQAQPAPE